MSLGGEATTDWACVASKVHVPGAHNGTVRSCNVYMHVPGQLAIITVVEQQYHAGNITSSLPNIVNNS